MSIKKNIFLLFFAFAAFYKTVANITKCFMNKHDFDNITFINAKFFADLAQKMRHKHFSSTLIDGRSLIFWRRNPLTQGKEPCILIIWLDLWVTILLKPRRKISGRGR
jgi:hypothetical protein